jgi:hypothetical protein
LLILISFKPPFFVTFMQQKRIRFDDLYKLFDFFLLWVVSKPKSSVD